MNCSAVVDRVGGRAGRTGTEKLEWRTDRRNLNVLVKKITDVRSIYLRVPTPIILDVSILQ